MTYEAWRTHCVKVVKTPMTIEQLRHDCGRLASSEAPNPEVILMHAMLALEKALLALTEKHYPHVTPSLESMAREAGAFAPGPSRNYWAVTEPALAAFAALVRTQAIDDAAAWLESQRADIPAHGWEFAAAIRAYSNAEVATCKPAD